MYNILSVAPKLSDGLRKRVSYATEIWFRMKKSTKWDESTEQTNRRYTQHQKMLDLLFGTRDSVFVDVTENV